MEDSRDWLILSFLPLFIVSLVQRISLNGDSVVPNFLFIINDFYLHFSS